MAERKITVSANPTKAQSVSVAPKTVQTYINATPDTSLYYSTISKKWAVEMDGLVNGEDYSSKYYAEQSAQSATEAQNFAEQAENSKNGLLKDTGFVAVKDNIDSIITNAVNIEDINIAAENIEDIKDASLLANEFVEIWEAGVANNNLSNLTEQGEKHFLNKSQITNCLLEVPQRIKLELNNGVLTLKAGSVVIVPNEFEADGVTPKFDFVTVESDVSFGNWEVYTNANSFILYDPTQKTITPWEKTLSGSTPPAADTHGIWYDTAYNLVNWTEGGNSNWNAGMSLPIALVDYVNGIPTSIDQVFNGLGYIGSTIWRENGIKYLISNYKNEDGTLKNIERVTQGIKIHNLTYGAQDYYLCLDENGDIVPAGVTITSYNEVVNIVTDTYAQRDRLWCMVGRFKGDANNTITNFQPKQPFRAIDYSDKSEVSGWGMPSGERINLAVGASGATYLAPANGWVAAKGSTTAANQFIALMGIGDVMRNVPISVASGNELHTYIPVARGSRFRLNYNTSNNVMFFIYAEGEI